MPSIFLIGTCIKSFATGLPALNKPNNPALAAPTPAAPAPIACKNALLALSIPPSLKPIRPPPAFDSGNCSSIYALKSLGE